MMIKFRKVIYTILSLLVFLTACGHQQDPEGMTMSPVMEYTTNSSEISVSTSETSAASDTTMRTEAGQRESDGGIVVANIYGESSFFSGRVINFGNENPAYGIEYLAAYEEAEPDRILMEVANGKGPDILYLSRRDLETLQANGALGEIGQFISDENRNALLPGAIQMGTYEDKLYAIPLSVYVRSLLTSRDYWQEDSWTVEDILSVLEKGHGIEGMFVDISGAEDYYYNMYFMMGIDIRHSPFINNDNSGFDCQEFRDLLVIIKNMTHNANNNSTPEDRMLPLTEGSYLGIECFFRDMRSFCAVYEKMGENANLVGYPCDMGNSHYLMDNGMLVINQNAVMKEGVSELINELLSLESQKYVSYAISVRTDLPESQLLYDKTSNKYIWMSPNNNGFQMAAKADGTSYVEEYLRLLKSAVPAAFESDELFSMVMEEANGYFISDKNVDEVIDTIQRRVQIYLDERK